MEAEKNSPWLWSSVLCLSWEGEEELWGFSAADLGSEQGMQFWDFGTFKLWFQ